MRCPRHDLALASDGKCVRCRREDEAAAAANAEPTVPSNAPRIVAIFVGGAIVIGAVVWTIRSSSTMTAIPSRSAPVYVAPSSSPLAPLEPAEVDAGAETTDASWGGPSPLVQAMRLSRITMYSRVDCGDCGRTRDWLLARGYTFKERNVDADDQARAAWRKASPGGTVPALDIDGQPLVGFDTARIQAALEYAGARRLQR
jgi:glutaredoxin